MATSQGALEKSIFFQKLVLKDSRDPKQKERAKKAIEKLQAELDSLMERKTNPATKKFSPAQIAAQKLFAERARAGTLGKGKRKANPVKGEKTFKNGDYVKTDRGEIGRVSFYKDQPKGYANVYRLIDVKANDPYAQTFLENGNFINGTRLKAYKPRMTIERDIYGVPMVKRNPDKTKPRAYVKRASQITGAPPSKRLLTRRKMALSAPAGYFPNPEPTHDFARIGKPFAFGDRTWKVSQYSHNGKTIEAYTTDRKKFVRREFDVLELMSSRRKLNPAAAMMTGYQVICMHPKKHVVGIFKTMAEAKLVARAMADAKGVAYGVKTVKVHKAHFAV